MKATIESYPQKGLYECTFTLSGIQLITLGKF